MSFSEFMYREIQFFIFDLAALPFVTYEGEELREIPQSDEDREFAIVDLDGGCRTGIYKEVTGRTPRRK